MIVQICVGSSCHLKGSEQIVTLLQNALEKNGLDNEVTLAGSFCSGQCNRIGVTVQIDDDVFTGVTPETFQTFFEKNVLERIKKEA